MHRQFFRETSPNPEFLENFCNDGNKPFHLACRKLHLDNQSP